MSRQSKNSFNFSAPHLAVLSENRMTSLAKQHFGKDDSMWIKCFFTLRALPSVCIATAVNPSNEICMILDEDGPFSVCTKLFDGNSKQPPKPLPRGRVFDIEHIPHYRLSKRQWIDFSDIVVFLCSALGLSSGRMQWHQRAGGAPQRFKRLEVGQPEEPNRYILSGKGLTMHWSRPNRSWRCTRPLKVEVWWLQYTNLAAWFLKTKVAFMCSSKQSLGEVLSKITGLDRQNKTQPCPESSYLLLASVNVENQRASTSS